MKTGRARSCCCGSSVMNLTSIFEDVGLIPGLLRWVKDPVLLCLQRRLMEPPYAAALALKRKNIYIKKQGKKKKQGQNG